LQTLLENIIETDPSIDGMIKKFGFTENTPNDEKIKQKRQRQNEILSAFNKNIKNKSLSTVIQHLLTKTYQEDYQELWAIFIAHTYVQKGADGLANAQSQLRQQLGNLIKKTYNEKHVTTSIPIVQKEEPTIVMQETQSTVQPEEPSNNVSTETTVVTTPIVQQQEQTIVQQETPSKFAEQIRRLGLLTEMTSRSPRTPLSTPKNPGQDTLNNHIKNK